MFKTERGITLVALIITIIVLVILATVSIATIANSGMINTAIQGTQNYSSEQKREEGMINETEDLVTNASYDLQVRLGTPIPTEQAPTATAAAARATAAEATRAAQ